MMEKKNISKPPSLQDVKTDMELSGAYRGIFKGIGYFVNPFCGNSYRGTFFWSNEDREDSSLQYTK